MIARSAPRADWLESSDHRPTPGLTSADGASVGLERGWLDAMPAWRRQAVLSHSTTLRQKEAGYVYRVGDPPDGLYGVMQGEVRLITYPEPGKQVLEEIVRPGDWFGELSVIDGRPRPHDAVACGGTQLHRLSMAGLQRAARADPELYRELAVLSAESQRRALNRIALMRGCRPVIRLARLLGELTTVPGDANRDLAVSQEDLASMVGITRQRLNILLKGFEAASLVELSYGRVRVVVEADQLLRAALKAGATVAALPPL